MSARSLIMSAAGNAGDKLYVDDVFSAWPYAGNGVTQTINNGIDLAGKGGMVWVKARTFASNHALFDTARGNLKSLRTNLTDAQYTSTAGNDLSGFTSSGFTLGPQNNESVNSPTSPHASWTFAEAPKFFKKATVTKSSGSNATVDLSSLGTIGMVMVKRTDAVGSWYVFHRSATTGKLLYLEQTAAEATLGHITVSGTTLTLVNGVIADGSYVVYAWAHDSSADGIVQCGSFTTDGSGNATVNLGWEPQYLMMKNATGAAGNWFIEDVNRGWSVTSDGILFPNLSNAETASGYSLAAPNAAGFTVINRNASSSYIYVAIRRPNKPPTTGTQVYNAIARTGTGAAATVTGVGFAPDLVMSKVRNGGGHGAAFDRLRGALPRLYPSAAASESSAYSDQVTSFGQDGMSVGPDASTLSVNAITPYIYHFFKRAPGVHDQICYGGTAVNKTEVIPVLGVPAELWLVKGRSGATQWVWGSSLLANTEKIVTPSPAGKVTDATAWNSTYPTATTLSLGTAAAVNTAAATYVAYLWATLAGVSKVFGYTGNGGTQLIGCGFTTGARFVMIICTTAGTAQDIFIWDIARGIVAGNDPHLSLNSTAAEVTTDDSIDPDVSGFIVNQLAATNINVNGATYIGLAYA